MSYSVNSGDSAGGDSKSQNADGSTGNEKLMVSYCKEKLIVIIDMVEWQKTIKLVFNLFLSRLLSVFDHSVKKRRAGE